ncbi:hypothetical protein BJ170DRAFT_600042 [Xylariales sp. AK1849]|nr:hypothetical protein BJ170DRAFT_600042 [Xylariales sp. AK1849]
MCFKRWFACDNLIIPGGLPCPTSFGAGWVPCEDVRSGRKALLDDPDQSRRCAWNGEHRCTLAACAECRRVGVYRLPNVIEDFRDEEDPGHKMFKQCLDAAFLGSPFRPNPGQEMVSQAPQERRSAHSRLEQRRQSGQLYSESQPWMHPAPSAQRPILTVRPSVHSDSMGRSSTDQFPAPNFQMQAGGLQGSQSQQVLSPYGQTQQSRSLQESATHQQLSILQGYSQGGMQMTPTAIAPVRDSSRTAVTVTPSASAVIPPAANAWPRHVDVSDPSAAFTGTMATTSTRISTTYAAISSNADAAPTLD